MTEITIENLDALISKAEQLKKLLQETPEIIEYLKLADNLQSSVLPIPAEGTPVEEMTIKKLREEIKEWKEKAAASEKQRDANREAANFANDRLEEMEAGINKLSDALEVHSDDKQEKISELKKIYRVYGICTNFFDNRI